MFNNTSDFIKLVEAYLENKSLFAVTHHWKAFNLSKEKGRLSFVINTLHEQLKRASLDFTFQVIAAIDELFIAKKSFNKTDIHDRMAQFKKALAQSEHNNWKNTLLNIHLRVVQNKHYISIRSIPHANYPIQLDSERFTHDDLSQPLAQNTYAFLGSTFVTNRQFILQNSEYVEDEAKEGHILDALFSAYTMDDQRCITGTVLAIGDGSGGHFGEEAQDQAIARAGHFATKYSARLMAAFQEPDALKQSLHIIIQHISDAVKRKYPRNRDGVAMYQEQTTLAAMRTFNQDNHVRVIGFNIGDSMIMSWHPESKRCQTLLPAHVRIFKGGQEATALVPLAYEQAEIQFIDMMLEPGTIVFPLTDGVYDDLPCHSQVLMDDTGQETKETRVDEKAMEALLSSAESMNIKTPVHVMVDLITKNVVQHVEARRADAVAQQQTLTKAPDPEKKEIEQPASASTDQKLSPSRESFFNDYADTQQQDIQIGDDFALYGIRLLDGEEQDIQQEIQEKSSGLKFSK